MSNELAVVSLICVFATLVLATPILNFLVNKLPRRDKNNEL